MGRPAAFFDLDRTLVAENTGALYAKFEHAQGRISTWQLVRATVWLGLYHLSLLDMEKAYNMALRHYEGTPERTLDERTVSWFSENIAHRLLPAAREAAEWHRGEGHPLVILTNSSSYQAAIARERWGFDDWIANRFPTDEAGCLLGTIEAPICYGIGKVERSERWAEENGVDLDASWFYSDSYSDLPMLERVGRPRVVNPDPRLSREAQRRGWPTYRWDETR